MRTYNDRVPCISILHITVLVVTSICVVPSETRACPPVGVSDFESPFSSSSFGGYSGAINSKRMSFVDSPSEPVIGKVLRMEAKRTDAGPTPNPRVQLSTSDVLDRCAEFWTAVSVFIPSMSPHDVENYLSVPDPHINYLQIYGKPYGGTAPLIFEQYYDEETRARRLRLRASSTFDGHARHVVAWSGPLIENSWFRLVMHVKMSNESDVGFVEFAAQQADHGPGIGGAAVKMSARVYFPTLSDVNSSASNHVDLQVYRPLRVPIESSIVYWADHRISNDYESVMSGW